MAYNVKFLRGTKAQYEALGIKDAGTLYFLTDVKELYLGENLYTSTQAVAALQALVGTTSVDAQIKAAIDALKLAETYEKLGAAAAVQGDTTETVASVDAKVAAINDADTGILKQAKDYTDAEVKVVSDDLGNVDDLSTTNKTAVTAINELKTAVDNNKTAGAVTVETDATGLVYTVKQGTDTVGTINIPKDMVVQSGTVETKTEAGEWGEAGTYIHLVLANATNDDIYINVGTLIDIYTAKADAAQVQVAIDSTTREISATIVAGSITDTELAANAVITEKIADANVTKAKLSTELQASIDKADNAATKVEHDALVGRVDTAESDITALKAAVGEGGSVDAQIDAKIAELDADVKSADVEEGKGIQVQVVEVDGKITTVAVTGNYDAAYDANGAAATAKAEAIADAATKAATAEQNAKDYADGLADNYDAKGSAADAETNAKAYTDEALTWIDMTTPAN